MNTNQSFISYEQYTKRFCELDIIDDIESQIKHSEEDDWMHYVDPETITDNQRSQLRLKKYWSDRNLNHKNIKLLDDDDNNDDNNIFYKRCIITICCVIVTAFFL